MELRLLGRDCSVPGSVEYRRLAHAGWLVEMASSPGGEAAGGKPNEDAILVLAPADGELPLLAAVADAHFGAEAAELALEGITQASARVDWRNLTEDGLDEGLVRLTRAAQAAVIESGTESESTLLVALASGKAVHWTSVGDSYLYRVRRDGSAKVINRLGRVWLGARLDRPILDVMRRGRFVLEPGIRVLLATDGVAEAVRNVPTLRPRQIAAVLDAGSERPLEALVQEALARGGEDNAAAVLLTAPAEESSMAASGWASLLSRLRTRGPRPK